MFKNKFLLFLLIFSLAHSIVFSQDISEFIGEIKFVNANGGYYVFISGGKQYSLVNLPRQQGQIKEGKYRITGLPSINDPLYTGPIPFQVTRMEFLGASQTGQNGELLLTGNVFFYNYGGTSTYLLEVSGANNNKTYYSLTGIAPGQIAEGKYNVKGYAMTSQSGNMGTPLKITKIEPATAANSQIQQDTTQQNNQNQEKQYMGMIMFRPIGSVGGIGYYMLQTQDNQQFALIDLGQEEGKVKPGYYNVTGAITNDAPNPYNINIPFMHISNINLISEIPGMNDNTNMFFQQDDGEEGGEEDGGGGLF
ncbi:MAG: hypothetical protein ABRQ39_05285 [Candidatus Eremiobacterota bacterium]